MQNENILIGKTYALSCAGTNHQQQQHMQLYATITTTKYLALNAQDALDDLIRIQVILPN